MSLGDDPKPRFEFPKRSNKNMKDEQNYEARVNKKATCFRILKELQAMTHENYGIFIIAIILNNIKQYFCDCAEHF
jgi:hypothetical protein